MIVGYSGGIDSAVLAHQLHKMGILSGIIHYIYFSDTVAEEKFCNKAKELATQAADSYSVPLYIGSGVISTKRNRESAWREQRYSFMNEVGLKIKSDGISKPVIAVAHHLDDQRDSYLMHLLKNTRRCFIPLSVEFEYVQVVRPFLACNNYIDITKSAILMAAYKNKISYIEDPMNKHGDRQLCTKANYYLRSVPNYNKKFLSNLETFLKKERARFQLFEDIVL